MKKTILMVVVTNILIIVIAAVFSLLWDLIGAVVGYRNSWFVAPIACFTAFLIAGRVVGGADPDGALRAQLAVICLFCTSVLLASLVVHNLGIPAWRVMLTLALASVATWAGHAVLVRTR
ncbi:MAG: hypothetical protein Q8O26_01505 [Phreatobacter sp.]|uniref:hypothetical protein n=1 Tax=Phreatobacter sp. TaxID=1966341 RepID=UPI002733BAA7|nr:hypothetical protein [Phreatobacter sp.]MDP2800537.1 hypothetical protein [Phreatobacter sp.]